MNLLLILSPCCEKNPSSYTMLDATFVRQIVDAIVMIFLTICGRKTTMIERASSRDLHEFCVVSRLVALSLKTLASVLTYKSRGMQSMASVLSNTADISWQVLMESLQVVPRGQFFFETGAEATRTILKGLRNMFIERNGVEIIPEVGKNAADALDMLTQYLATDDALMWYMKYDANGSCILRLVQSCLNFVVSPLAVPPFVRKQDSSHGEMKLVASHPPYMTSSGEGCAEKLAARGFVLLHLLGDVTSTRDNVPDFFDASLKSIEGRALTEGIMTQFLEILGQILLRPSVTSFAVCPGEAQLTINVLRAAEYLSDESNFKDDLIPALAPSFAKLLYTKEPSHFNSTWGHGLKSVIQMGSDDDLIYSPSEDAQNWRKSFQDASRKWKNKYYLEETGKKTKDVGLRHEDIGLHLALEKTILMAKIIENLQSLTVTSANPQHDFVLNMVQFINDACEDEATKRKSFQNFKDNIRFLFHVAKKFGGKSSSNIPALMLDIDMEQSELVLEAVKNHTRKHNK